MRLFPPLLIVTLCCTYAAAVPTVRPTWRPTVEPTFEPTPRPTHQYAPTRYPTPAPTYRPSPVPTPFPTLKGGVHNTKQPTPAPSLGMASYAMHYDLFDQEVTLADMMAIAVTIWGTIFVFALRHHYKSTGASEKLNSIRLDEISMHSEMSDTSHTPALQGADSNSPPPLPFNLKKHNIFNLSGSRSKEVVEAAVASALDLPTSSTTTNSSTSVMSNIDTAPLPIPEEEEENLRL